MSVLEPDGKVFVLVGEYEGDYGDHYQRYREAVAVSKSKEVLEGYKSSIKESEEYVEYDIEEVPMIGWVKNDVDKD